MATALATAAAPAASAQTPPPRVFTHADTLRGGNGPGRAWWDAEFYDLHVRVNSADSSISGHNAITYKVLQPATQMQIDLQMPLEVDSIVQQSARLQYRRDGNAFFVTLPAAAQAGDRGVVTVWYHGNWRRAPGDTATRRRNAGPVHWSVDSAGAPWIATSNEGPGASTWWPLKDLPADEPDSQRIAVTVPDPMIDVSNGRLRSITKNTDGTTTFEWFVANPLNTYDVAINASRAYVPVRDEYTGEK
ncbi:MAG: M1 family peptidase, partial [Gemmatimonadota bacterium]